MDIKKPKQRSGSTAKSASSANNAKKRPAAKRPANRTAKPAASKSSVKPPSSSSLRHDIDEALRAIDQENAAAAAHAGKTVRRKRWQRKPWSRKRKIITWSIVGTLTALALIASFYIYRIASNTGSIFQGNIFDALLSSDQLQKDSRGRSNILIFGTSEDDPGHSGAALADSIMVLSIDQETKDAFTVSLPRDLWVQYDTPCSLGSEGKLNAAYYCGLEARDNDQHKASLAFAQTVGKVIGTDVQYYVAVNYSVVRGLVDSLGGIDVTIHSDDPRGIYDISTGLKLPSGTQHIDGDTALDLARARNSKGGYGLAQSNFDREKNQQQVLKAIQQKALQSGTLTNPNKVVALTESVGKNIRTNVKTSELRTALDVAAGIRSDDIASRPLNDPDNMLVTTGRHSGASIVRPVKGLFDYSDIHRYLWPEGQSRTS